MHTTICSLLFKVHAIVNHVMHICMVHVQLGTNIMLSFKAAIIVKLVTTYKACSCLYVVAIHNIYGMGDTHTLQLVKL